MQARIDTILSEVAGLSQRVGVLEQENEHLRQENLRLETENRRLLEQGRLEEEGNERYNFTGDSE